MVKNAFEMKGGPALTIAEPNEKEGKIFRTEIEIRVPVFIPIPEITNLEIKISKLNCIISLKHTKDSPKESGFVLQGNTWFEDDRWGRVYRSIVKITFDHTSNPIALYGNYPLDMLQEGLKVVNRIIEVSRIVVDKYFLYRVVDADIPSYTVKGFGSDGLPIKGASIHHSNPGLITVMSQDKIFYHYDKSDEILEIIKNGIEIPLEKGLIRNARDYLFSENYRSAIIEAQTAVEIKIQEVIRQGMRKNGKTDTEIETFLEPLAFKHMIEHHLKNYLKNNFMDEQSVYNDWKNNCYTLRNKVAHEGLYPIKLQAESAINAAKNAVDFLEKNNLNS